MEKTVKCLLLDTNTVVVSEVVEVVAELGDPNCKLINPYLYNEEKFQSWPKVTEQNEIMIRSDSILTIVDPKEEILEKYLELTA